MSSRSCPDWPTLLELARIESLNDDPAFVRALAELVEERLAVSGKSAP